MKHNICIYQRVSLLLTAFIVPPKGPQPEPAALKSFLKEHLAGFKVPREFIVVEDLPKNNAGKLLKREIKKKFG
jgi:acyl-CoA synthetase (AMP-forming)/AMP-acid ligase II